MNGDHGTFPITTGAVSSTVSVTGVGFMPDAVILFWNSRTGTSNAVGRANGVFGVGVGVSSSERWCVGTWDEDAADPTNSERFTRADACVFHGSTGVDGLADFVSMDSDGFTLIIDDQFNSSHEIHYLALGGDDVTDVAAGNFQSADDPSIGSTQDFTSLSFQPDFVLVANRSSSTVTGDASNGVMALGWAVGTGTGDQYGGCWGTDDNVSGDTDTGSNLSDSQCIKISSTGSPGAPSGRAQITSFLSNGFELTWTEPNPAVTIFYLAMKGGGYATGSIASRTDTTEQTESGVGFQPTGLFFLTQAMTGFTGADSRHFDCMMSIGAASSITSRSCIVTWDEDNETSGSVHSTGSLFDEMMGCIDWSDDASWRAYMDVTEFNSDGFKYIMDDEHPSETADIAYIAFGASTTPGEITETASVDVQIAGEVTNAGSVRLQGPGEITSAASVNISIPNAPLFLRQSLTGGMQRLWEI